MRRLVIALAVLLVLLLVTDRIVRVRVEDEIEQAAARRFSAATVDADITGVLVLPQLLTGRLERVEVALGDAVAGDPPIRLATLDVTLLGVRTGFPPPASIEDVEVEEGTLVLGLHEREVERLLLQRRPGWSARITAAGIVATGEVAGAPVQVVAEPIVGGDGIRIRTREVDAGELGPDAARQVAQAFDTTIAVDGLPPGVRLVAARTEPTRLLLDGVVDSGALPLS